MRDVELPISFCSFFQLMVFVSENAENKMLFVTQFIFHLNLTEKLPMGKHPAHSTCLVDFCTIVALKDL